jgi:DNA-binding CsgD family transcriptional regulator
MVMNAAMDQILAGWLCGESRARIVVDRELSAHWVSDSAEALMQSERSVLHRNGRIVPKDPRLEGELRTFVATATGEVSTHCFANRDTGDQIVLAARRLPHPWSHLVGITLRHAGDHATIRLADLRQPFGLTATEARVAEYLLCGCTAEETALRLKVSLETVRTHIKRAYGKLGVRSRERFFHKLAPFVISVD